MILPVLQYPDPRLKQKSVPIKKITEEIKELAFNMVETMYARNGIGLAAPQVGEFLRLVVIDVTGPEQREDVRILVNPILTLSGPEMEAEEGCLSVADFRSNVYRCTQVHCKATSLEGTPLSFDATDMLAICLQHECDHLDGLLFVDHISRLKKNMYDKKLTKKSKG